MTNVSKSFHATSVAVDGAAVMIIGPSRSGKSSLALELIGLGAQLVADDMTTAIIREGALFVQAPDRLRGVIEARGVGLIRVPWCKEAALRLVVDMGEDEIQRLPTSSHFTNVLDFSVDTVRRVQAPYFASAVLNLLRYGRADTA